MQTRIFTRINELRNPLKVKHFVGFPPELTDGKDRREILETPALAIIEESADGIFLKRYDRSGRCVGDTWHMSLDDAKEQAIFEYGPAIAGWKDVPNGVSDAVSFGLAEES
jgi:hypothetical protein